MTGIFNDSKVSSRDKMKSIKYRDSNYRVFGFLWFLVVFYQKKNHYCILLSENDFSMLI